MTEFAQLHHLAVPQVPDASWLHLEQWVLNTDWDRFCLELTSRTLSVFQARRVFLLLPEGDQLLIHAQAVNGQRALTFAEAQNPANFFGLALAELERQLREPALSIQPVDYSPHEIWDDQNEATVTLYRVILPLLQNKQLIGLLYIEFGDLDHVSNLLDSPAFRLECDTVAMLLAERREATRQGRVNSPDEITERLRASLLHAEEDRAQLQKLHQVTLKLTEATDLDTLYRLGVTMALSELDIDRMGIFEIDVDQNEMRGTWGTDNNGELTDEHWFKSPLPVHSMFEESVKRPGEVIVNEDAALYYNKVVVGRGWNAMVSLWMDDKMVGWIAADNFLRRRPLQPSQREMLRLFAAILAQLIRVKRINQEIRALNQELAAARDAAEEASRAKSEFLATISHEIRTPLNGVLGFVQLLRNTPLDDEQTEYVATIAYSGDTLLSLINDLLDFSKIEAGKFVLENQPFDLRVAAAEACAMLGARAAEKRLSLKLVIDPACPTGYNGDAMRLKQILVNLIGNALKFTEAGEVRVSLEAHANGDQQGVRIAVADTGIGIAPDKLDQLFQRFYQVDSSSTRRYGGTGLGLAICKLLVEQMNGEIGVIPTPAQGTTFWFTLPANPADAGDTWAKHWQSRPEELATLTGRKLAWVAASPYRTEIEQGLADCGIQWVEPDDAELLLCNDAPIDAGDAARLILSWDVQHDLPPRTAAVKLPLITLHPLVHQLVRLLAPLPDQVRLAHTIAVIGHRRRVLLAEDSLINQRVLSYFLTKQGFDVVVANDGLEAIDCAAHQDFDLVLMDWQMPRLDGLEAARLLRQDVRTSRWPIIALTANASADSEALCLEAGMNAFIPKPVDLAKLDAMIQFWLPPLPTDPPQTPSITSPTEPTQ
ncbi:hybrid sensor histidine kinase/response regulator [Andreprevotia chitinilytica]|uniref:hybrid sensor histidine kinase/response regulator n=1 Tax=Andreprevotia chitinilytica TaxID=396808 RepID=UPI00068D637F|nr:ATP-binding protein [Andreprevotia chitinilytica]